MPTLRSQYQHVRNDISKCSKTSVGGTNNNIDRMVASVQSSIPINTQNNFHKGIENLISPSKSVVSVTASASNLEEEKNFGQPVKNLISPGGGKKSSRSRKNSSRNSTGSRKSSQGSSRRSSGSLSEDVLNTATVVCTATTNEAPVYTSSSQPTLMTQSGGLTYNNSFASYKHLAESAIMQSLHQKLPVMDPLPSVYTDENNFLYLDQQLIAHQPYIPLLMKARMDPLQHHELSSARSSEYRHDKGGGGGRHQDAGGGGHSLHLRHLNNIETSTSEDYKGHDMRNLDLLRPQEQAVIARAHHDLYTSRYHKEVRSDVSLSLSGSSTNLSHAHREMSSSMQSLVNRPLAPASSMSSLVSELQEEVSNNCSDEALRSLLERNDCFETKEGLERRQEIVKSLDTLVKQWTRSCGIKKGLNYTVLESNQGKVLTYGSCKLEANDQDADMDLICVAPNFVERNDFFNNLFDTLKSQSCVKDLRRLPEVFVPVMKFKFNDIEIDFTFSQLNLEVPENEEELLDEKYTRSLSDRCLRSLNGYRATCQILTLVPNVKVFQLSLCAIKLWGRVNGVYGNILGYLGGASWAILVAKTCQEHSRNNYEPTAKEIVFAFFQMYSEWKWPNPVFIRQVADQPMGAWNPNLNSQDRDHVMPIITSSVPQMNSAVNISKSVQRYIQERMRKAHNVCIKIQNGEKTWEALFKPFSFYEEYETFIKITGNCDQDSCFWFGCLESKLRHFKEKIEMSSKIHSVRIWPKGYIREDSREISTWSSQTWFIGFVGSGNHAENIIYEDFHTLKERCYSDLKKNYGHSYVTRAFSVHMEIIHRSEIFKFLRFEELKMKCMDNETYSTSAQDMCSQASTPAGGGRGGQGGRGHSAPYSQGVGQSVGTVTTSATVTQAPLQSGKVSGATLAPPLTGSSYSHHNVLSSLLAAHHAHQAPPGGTQHLHQQTAAMFLPNVFPYYPALGASLYQNHGGVDNLSPPVISSHKQPQNSPRLVNSPKHIPGRVPAAASPIHHNNSPTSHTQFIYPEGITAVGQHFYPNPNSPKLPYHHPTYSPRQQQLGPFPFPPPVHTAVVTASPPPVVVRSEVTPPTPPPPSSNVRTFPGIQRRDVKTTVVSGVTTINNNLKAQAICSCQSVSDVDKETFKRPSVKIKETDTRGSTSDDERLRSISNSSDSVPPSSIYRTRINHQDALPPSPRVPNSPSSVNTIKKLNEAVLTSVPAANIKKHAAEPVPLSEIDISVPPPVKICHVDAVSIHSDDVNNGCVPTFCSAEITVKRRATRSPRLSISELNDAPSPVPVQLHKNRTNIMVNLYHNGGDDVFTR